MNNIQVNILSKIWYILSEVICLHGPAREIKITLKLLVDVKETFAFRSSMYIISR